MIHYEHLELLALILEKTNQKIVLDTHTKIKRIWMQ